MKQEIVNLHVWACRPTMQLCCRVQFETLQTKCWDCGGRNQRVGFSDFIAAFESHIEARLVFPQFFQIIKNLLRTFLHGYHVIGFKINQNLKSYCASESSSTILSKWIRSKQ